MGNMWHGIEAGEAERRLRGLRRRLSELDVAITDHQSLLRDYPQSFAMQLSAKNLLAMQSKLRREEVELISHRRYEHLQIALRGENFSNHSASIADLSVIFSRLQRMYSSVGQSIKVGPTLRGPLRADVVAATTLRLNGIYASSFGMDINVPSAYDPYGNSLSSDAIAQMFQVFSSVKTEQNLMRISGEVGRRAMVHFRHLAVLLKDTNSDMRIDWKDSSGTQYMWDMDATSAEKAIRSIDNISQTRSETKSLNGYLVGASLLRNRFEILTPNGNLVEGKFVVGLEDDIQASFAKDSSAKLEETEVLDRASGDSRTYYTLLEIEPTGLAES